MRTAALLTTLAFLAACGSPSPAEPAPAGPTSGAEETSAETEEGLYPIRLSRSAQVGDRYREHTVHARRMVRSVSVPGRQAEQSEDVAEVEILARVLVRAVNTQGKPTEMDYEIERCVRRDPSGEHEVVPAGSVVRLTRMPRSEGEGSIELVGGALSDGQHDSLDMVMSTTVSPNTDDMVFGSEAPRRVGESWPIDGALAAQDLNKMPEFEIGRDQVTGQTTLVAAEDVEGVPCLRLRAEMRAQGFSMTGLPEGSATERAELTATMTGDLPTDTAMGTLAEVEEMQMRLRLRVPGGATIDLEVADREASEYER